MNQEDNITTFSGIAFFQDDNNVQILSCAEDIDIYELEKDDRPIADDYFKGIMAAACTGACLAQKNGMKIRCVNRGCTCSCVLRRAQKGGDWEDVPGSDPGWGTGGWYNGRKGWAYACWCK